VRHVLVTDFAWKDLNIEEDILRQAGASLLVASTGAESELLELAPMAHGILTCWKPLTEKVIRKATRCVSIGRFGIGLDNIDVPCATEVGMVVTNVPSYCIDEVSDHAIALLLSCARKIAFYDRNIKSGIYDLKAGTPLYRLRGKILGIVGFGKIGRAVSAKARAFGFNIIVCDPHLDERVITDAGFEGVSFRDLIRRSDAISIHIPLSPDTSHLFTSEIFREMKSTSIIVNTSRGDVIDSRALLMALDEGLIAGAGLDVLSEEPPARGDRLTSHPKTVVTPHAAFNSEESVSDLRKTAASQMADALVGRYPQNIVNTEVLRCPNLRCGRPQ
jgi:D-3-phosphoglycerate dehydrogenase / 2-oxoglutarate reductase